MRSSIKLAVATLAMAMLSGCIIRTNGYSSGGYVASSGYGGWQQQLQVGGAQANFGVVQMGPGFQPDPVQVQVRSGGYINARTLGLPPGCIGWVSRVPDYIVRFTGATNNLRFFVQAGSDSTLIINAPNSAWYCNDDSPSGGTNPMVDIPGAGPGQYDVWVGSYSQGNPANGILSMTELGYTP